MVCILKVNVIISHTHTELYTKIMPTEVPEKYLYGALSSIYVYREVIWWREGRGGPWGEGYSIRLSAARFQ